jgi:hypothetical protein
MNNSVRANANAIAAKEVRKGEAMRVAGVA